MHVSKHGVLVGFLSALALSCGGTQKPSAKPVDPAVTDMHRHFDEVNQIQQALISGELGAAKEFATRLRAGFAGATPEGWRPFVERTVASAEMMEASESIEMAARIAGTMAGTCGDCHRAQGMRAVEDDGSSPSSDDFMRRHRWATDRLWDGLIGPSEKAWQAGAQVLSDSKFTPQQVEGYIETTPEILALIDEMQSSSQRALSTQGPEERQLLYGNLLAGCAQCHSRMLAERD